MKCLPALTAVAFFALSSQAMAILGETKAQIEARWGEPVEIRGYPDERTYTYRTGPFQVEVVFLDGVSQFEHYRHPGKWSESALLDEAEIQELLQRNSSGQKWKRDGDRYRLPDRTASAPVNMESGKHQSIYFETEKYGAQLLNPQKYVRTGTTRTFSGVPRLRQVENSVWLVLHDNGYVLEIPWSAPGFPSAVELVAGRHYTITLLDEQSWDTDVRTACLSDREHKDWSDAVYDSKSYLLARIQDGSKVLFDRSVCEVHHLPMIQRKVPIEYGLPVLDIADVKFPHHRNYIQGGCMVMEEKEGDFYVCPVCVVLSVPYKWWHSKNER